MKISILMKNSPKNPNAQIQKRECASDKNNFPTRFLKVFY